MTLDFFSSVEYFAQATCLLDKVRRSVMGYDRQILTPFGLRRIICLSKDSLCCLCCCVHLFHLFGCFTLHEKPILSHALFADADYTASGRSLSFIEDFIREYVLALYSNTHSETSFVGAQMTKLREEARSIIHECVHGDEDDIVLFCGSGATGAVNKLVRCLGIRIPEELDEVFGYYSFLFMFRIVAFSLFPCEQTHPSIFLAFFFLDYSIFLLFLVAKSIDFFFFSPYEV